MFNYKKKKLDFVQLKFITRRQLCSQSLSRNNKFQ